jgi:hypothetical protein
MRSWPIAIAACLWFAVGSPAVAASAGPTPTSDRAWCDASWPAIVKSGAVRTDATARGKKVPAYCQARLSDIDPSGRGGDEALRQFMARCASLCRSLTRNGSENGSTTAVTYLTPALLAATAAALAASATARHDQPASP